jgi:hypothetical protein
MTEDDRDRLETLARSFTPESCALLDDMPEAELWALAGMMVDTNTMAPVVADYASQVRRARFYDWVRPHAGGLMEHWAEFRARDPEPFGPAF